MIVAGMATMPDRLPYLEEAVASIRPQVDCLKVYLNGFAEKPACLEPDEAVLSSEAQGDLGAGGKFYWIDGKDGLDDYTHYLSIDDDIHYPPDYATTLVREFAARGGRAIVGLHGTTFLQPMEDFVRSRAERMPFHKPLAAARAVHMLGTATTLWSRTTIDLVYERDFSVRNTCDLQLAIAAQHQQVPMVAIPRPAQWLQEIRPWDADGFSIYRSTLQDGPAQSALTALAKQAVQNWVLYPDPIHRSSL
jgi:hypothetical protein